jgi:phenylacetic acid degradation operon negative regulatory protein
MNTQRFLLFLFAQADSLPVPEAIELGRLLGKSPSSLRGCVSRLNRSGLLRRTATGRGKTRFSLSPAGRLLASDVAQKFMHIHAIVENRSDWDGTWTLVSFDIAEKVREKRDRFRTGLKEMGFGSLSSGLWIAPRDKSSSVFALAEFLKILGKVIVSTSKDIRYGGEPVSHHLGRIWPLNDLNRRYERMKKRMILRLQEIRQKIDQGRPPDAREAFVNLFLVFTEAAELVAQDPCLPQELLPDNWLGLEVQDLIHEYFHLIHGLELNDPYAYLLRLPDGLEIPTVRHTQGAAKHEEIHSLRDLPGCMRNGDRCRSGKNYSDPRRSSASTFQGLPLSKRGLSLGNGFRFFACSSSL